MKCCKDDTVANCPEVGILGWTCSSAYADATLKKGVCPFHKKYCTKTGTEEGEIELTGSETAAAAVTQTVVNLPPGEVCFYTFRAKCNAPKVEVQAPVGGDTAELEAANYEDEDAADAEAAASGGVRLLFEDDFEEVEDVEDSEEVEELRILQSTTATAKRVKRKSDRMEAAPNSDKVKKAKGTAIGKPRDTKAKKAGEATDASSVVVSKCPATSASDCGSFNKGKKLAKGQAKCGTGKTSNIIITNTKPETTRRDLAVGDVSMTLAASAETLSDFANTLASGAMVLVSMFMMMA
jgi:hypothetical protein